MRNRVKHTAITPTSFSDHKLITIECSLVNRAQKSYYWHFNIKLLDDKQFCENFGVFWETCKNEKVLYENIIQWWEISKVHIKGFCQQYATHSSLVLKKTLELLKN